MNNSDTLFDPLGGQLTPEQREKNTQVCRLRNYNTSVSLGGAISHKRHNCACSVRAYRYFTWKGWWPGRVEVADNELTGQYDTVPHICALDSLVWLQIGNEQRVFSAQALRELADIADRVDSTKPETWVSE